MLPVEKYDSKRRDPPQNVERIKACYYVTIFSDISSVILIVNSTMKEIRYRNENSFQLSLQSSICTFSGQQISFDLSGCDTF